jgi:hypothetical protein
MPFRRPKYSVKLFQLLLLPANKICNRLELIDENERGAVRVLVNTLLCTTMSVFIVWMF